MPLEAITAASALISFGLAHDWRFERDFKKRNPEAAIHCYDHTVSQLTAFQYSIGQFLRFLIRLKTRYLWKSFAWIDYLVFFRNDRIHFRQRVWRDRQDNSVTVDDVFSRLPKDSQVFVKMDIEGSEYRILNDLLRHSQRIVALAVEFHDVDILPELFNSMVEKIKDDFHIVHIHSNNFGGLAPFNFPIAPEISFLGKRFFESPPVPSPMKYPLRGLDAPNYPDHPDFVFEF